MRHRRWCGIACCGVMCILGGARRVSGQSVLPAAEPITTLHISTQIVALDVTVVDRKGHPVTAGLGRDDFTVMEDRKPQRILSFEPPDAHLVEKAAEADAGSFATVGATVFVLDELNSSFGEVSFYRSRLERYLKSLPETLQAPAELMVLSPKSMEVVQRFTRSRASLLSALARIPANNFLEFNIERDERLLKSFSALEGIALENLGGTAKRNVIWLGRGAGIVTVNQTPVARARIERYIRYMTNSLVEARLTLYVIYPATDILVGLSANASQRERGRDVNVADPYDGVVNFRSIAAETGGFVYTGRTDLDAGMAKALDGGTHYYTLTYRPDDAIKDSRFRQIRVVLKDPNLRVVTKNGYYAPDQQEEAEPSTRGIFQMTEAGKSTLPFHDLEVYVVHIVRHPDRGTTEFTLFTDGKNLPWRPDDRGRSLAEFTVGGLSLSKRGSLVASYFRNVNMLAATQDAGALEQATASFKLVVDTPSTTERVRLVVRALATGRMGTVDVSGEAMRAAPELPSSAVGELEGKVAPEVPSLP